MQWDETKKKDAAWNQQWMSYALQVQGRLNASGVDTNDKLAMMKWANAQAPSERKPYRRRWCWRNRGQHACAGRQL
jgi:hypothetical protein